MRDPLSATLTDPRSPLPTASARVLANRYRLEALIGRGAFGDVWRATDLLTGDVVATKLVRPETGTQSARVRREIAVLRLLRVPGTLHLIDEGYDGGQTFLVTECIEGQPFPAAPLPVEWESISRTTIALLETLGRIHAAGVIHRDLKPGNVLVNPDGRPTVLDFGLAWDNQASDLTERGQILGTPTYLAPEQALGDDVTPGTDLYAVGVMLYEALSGVPPFVGYNLLAIVGARLLQRPTPLRDRAPTVPDRVAAMVDRMLSRDPLDRPRSASDAIAMLVGQYASMPTEPTLRRLGGDAPVQAILDAARGARSLDVVGAPGSGRSRCLHDAGAVLAAEGRELLHTRAGRRAFECLEPISGPLDLDPATPLDAVVAEVEARLRARLASGAVVLADDAERLDPYSAAALQRCRDTGTVVRALVTSGTSAEDEVHLQALDTPALRTLFGGPERIFHLPSDAAAALWQRTEGLPLHVANEIDAWVRAGLARWDGGRILVERESLDYLAAGLGVGAAATRGTPSQPPRAPLPAHLEDLLAWVCLAGPHAVEATLARATGSPAWQLEADVGELVALGVVRRLADGRLKPAAAIAPLGVWSPERRQGAHAAIAAVLPPGTDGRLLHLVSAARDDSRGDAALAVAAEALARARAFMDAGQPGSAVAILSEALRTARALPDDRDVEREAIESDVLAAWVEAALAEGSPRSLDRVLYEISRVTEPGERTGAVEALVRAALAARAGGDRGLAIVEALAPFAEPNLEWWRQAVRVQAARRCSLAREETVLAEVFEAGATANDEMRASLSGWLGRLRYRQGRFDDAAALHMEAEAAERRLARRLGAMTGVAASLLEAFRHEEAAAWADRLRSLAMTHRHAYFEAWGECLVRSAAYRRGETIAPDRELIEATGMVGLRDMEALLYLNEAAVAWRAGLTSEAAALAMSAHRLWSESGWSWGAMLARVLAAVVGEPVPRDDLLATGDSVLASPLPRVGLQTLGLLAGLCPEARSRWSSAALVMAESVPRERWGDRLEVTSVSEALGALGLGAALRDVRES